MERALEMHPRPQFAQLQWQFRIKRERPMLVAHFPKKIHYREFHIKNQPFCYYENPSTVSVLILILFQQYVNSARERILWISTSAKCSTLKQLTAKEGSRNFPCYACADSFTDMTFLCINKFTPGKSNIYHGKARKVTRNLMLISRDLCRLLWVNSLMHVNSGLPSYNLSSREVNSKQRSSPFKLLNSLKSKESVSLRLKEQDELHTAMYVIAVSHLQNQQFHSVQSNIFVIVIWTFVSISYFFFFWIEWDCHVNMYLDHYYFSVFDSFKIDKVFLMYGRSHGGPLLNKETEIYANSWKILEKSGSFFLWNSSSEQILRSLKLGADSPFFVLYTTVRPFLRFRSQVPDLLVYFRAFMAAVNSWAGS